MAAKSATRSLDCQDPSARYFSLLGALLLIGWNERVYASSEAATRLHSRILKPLDGLPAALRELRRRREILPAELARRSGLSYAQVQRYEKDASEKGSERPSISSLQAYLDGLGFDLYDLAHALDQVNGREPMRFPGNARPEWVAALSRRGLSSDIIWGFAFGALKPGDEVAARDFIESVVAVARGLAKQAVDDMRASMVAEPPPDDEPSR